MGSCASSHLGRDRDVLPDKHLSINNNRFTDNHTSFRPSSDTRPYDGNSHTGRGSDDAVHAPSASKRSMSSLDSCRDVRSLDNGYGIVKTDYKTDKDCWQNTVTVLKRELIRRRRIWDTKSPEHVAAECVALAIVNATICYNRRSNGEG